MGGESRLGGDAAMLAHANVVRQLRTTGQTEGKETGKKPRAEQRGQGHWRECNVGWVNAQ